MLTQTAGERPSLNLTKTAHWQDRWWLLDVETSGLDRQKDDIIALRLACMENYGITQEQEILVHPRRPLTSWAEGLTGISNQDLEQAASLNEAINRLAELDGPLLLLDRGFTIPFLQNAYLRCGKEFTKPCLMLDRLAALLLGCSPRQRAERFLEKLPPPNGLWSTPPQDPDLKKLYALSLAVFHALEETYQVQNTAQLAAFYAREEPL